MKFKKLVSAVSALTVAAGCIAGMTITASAEGTTTITPQLTYVDYSNQDSASGFVEQARAGYNKISGGSVAMANAGWGVNYVTFLRIDASSVTDTITNATLSLKVSGSTDSKRAGVYGVYYADYTNWDENLTYNIASSNGMLSVKSLGSTYTTATESANTYETYTVDITEAFKDDTDNIVTIGVYATNPAGGYIKEPSLTIESSSNSKDYAINYIYNGETIKSDQGSSAVGAVIGIDTYFTAEGVKYYAIDGSPTELEISNDDSANKIDITLRLAEQYTIVANAVADGFSKTVSNGSVTVTEGEEVYFTYPRYVLDNGKLYETPLDTSSDDKGFQYRVTNANSENTIVSLPYEQVYTDDEIAFFSEAEDIDGLVVTDDAARLSNGKGAYAATPTTITTLPAGQYKIITDGRNHGNAKTATYKITANGKTIIEPTINAYIQQTTSEFTLAEETDLVLSELTSEETNLDRFGIDYFLIIKTGDVTPAFSIDLGDAYVSNGTEDFAGQVATGYIATISNAGAEGTTTQVNVTVDAATKSAPVTVTLANGASAYIGMVLNNVNGNTQSVTATVE